MNSDTARAIRQNPKLADPGQLVRLVEARILTTDEARTALNLPPKEGAPVSADPVAFRDHLTAQHRRLEERMKLANERLEERLREIAA